MSDVLRSTTFQLEFNGDDGITGVKTFTKAVRDSDAVVDELNRTLGENTTVTVKNVQGKKELTAQARLVANQMARNENKTQRLTQQFNNMQAMVGKTADEIQVLNAVQQLGANATDAQRKQVEQSVLSYQKLRDAQQQQQGSLRNSRGVMQNFGWQMQDTIVQLQMGTSAFTVLSQQGSQMAAAFGPKGAVIGAVIALAGVVGGTLFTSLMSATEQTKKLDAANKALNEYLKLNSEGVVELTAKYEELARFSKIAADAQLQISRNQALEAQSESLKLVNEEVKSLQQNLTTLDKYTSGGDNFAGLGVSKNIDLMKESFKRLQGSVTPENIENFVGYLSELETSGKKGDKTVSELISTLNNQLVSLETNKEILKQTEDGWKDLGDGATETSDKILSAFEKEAQSTKKQTETLDEEYKRRMQIILDFVESGKQSEEDAVAAATRLTKWKKDEEKKIEQKAFDDKWKLITKSFEQESNRTTKQTETIGQEYARRYQVIKDYIEKPGHDAEKVAKATVELEIWKSNALAKEYEKRERVRRQIENAQISARSGRDPRGAENDRFNANIQTLVGQSTEEMELDEKIRIHGLIEAEVERHKQALADINLESKATALGTFQLAAQAMNETVNLITNGANQVKEQTENMTAAQKAMFITMKVIAAAQAFVNGIQMGTQLAAAAALLDPTGITSINWIGIGTAIGAAQAGAIMGTTIAGAFDNGGYIPAGQMGAVAGFGDEFVNGTLIQGPANVTSRKDTAELLRDGAGNNGGMTKLNISVENKIEGGQYRVEQISEDRVKIIAEQVFSKNIDSGVSSALSNNNSKTSKSMRRNYKVGRNL